MDSYCLTIWIALLLLLVQRGVVAKTLLLGGGYISNSNSEIWHKIVTIAGGRGSAKIGILTCASSEPIQRGHEYKALFESYGAQAYWIPIYDDNKGAAQDEEVIKNIKDMTGFFFGGGVQQKYIENLLLKNREPTPALKQILAMYENGTIVSGTSAGAMAMPKVNTIVDGTSYGALLSGALKVGEETTSADLLYDSLGGLGLFDRHVVDSHFHERSRHGRLIRLLSDTKSKEKGTPYGIGIDEETALLITHVDGEMETAEVFGKNGVSFIDTSKSYVDISSPYFRVHNVLVHYLTMGDRMDLTNNTVHVSRQKKAMKGNENREFALISTDIFAPAKNGDSPQFKVVAESLFNSKFDAVTYGKSAEPSPQFYVIMTKDAASMGYYQSDRRTTRWSYSNMKIEIRSSTLLENDNDDD